MALRGSIECLTKCTNQLSHQHVWLLTNVTNEKANQTMRPIEIETFGKSLTICRASRTALYIYDCNVFLLWIHFFPSLLLIFKLIRRPNITLPLPQPKQFEKKQYNLSIVIVNSLFGNQRLCWNDSKNIIACKGNDIDLHGVVFK